VDRAEQDPRRADALDAAPRLSSGSGWPPTASVSSPPRSSPQTIVTGASSGRWRSARLTCARIADGLASNAPAVRAV